ncbi:MAG: 16S rRNA processing protein RimM [Ekhidna sp.]|nr:16S rRNA processing protein RimM [Ekhidna sp.]
MKQNDCYQLGEVIKTHGLHGEVTVLLEVDFPEEYRNLESVFLEQQGRLVPFFISTIQINQDRALIKFEEIDSLDSARTMVKSKLYLPLNQLPELEEDQYYFHDLVNCEVFEEDYKIGVIKEVIDFNSNQLLAVQNGDREILIPLKDEIVLQVDIENKKVLVDLPEGLLEIYDE